MMTPPRRSNALRALGILVVLFLSLLPLVWTLLAALGLQPVRLQLTGTATLDNFGAVGIFEPAFITEFLYTLVVAVTATLITIAAAFPAAYLLARWESYAGTRARGRVDGLMQGMLVLAISPLIAYALPLENLERAAGLYGTFQGLVLAMAAVQIPLALWLLRGYLERIPRSLDEAAILDGASWATILWRVALPVGAGGVIATAVLVFVLDWNLFLLPSVLTEHPPMVLPMAMRDFFAFERDLEWPTAAAALVVTLAPAFLLVFATQRALEKIIFVPVESAV
jgi:ABC-type glycerol-3-phosphate transport system permease component